MRSLLAVLALLVLSTGSCADTRDAAPAGPGPLAAAVDPHVANWWYEPIFYPKGELALDGGETASTQQNYERFMTAMALWRIDPGTVVITGKWCGAYGDASPDPGRWPDLRGFIDRYERRGYRLIVSLRLGDSPSEQRLRKTVHALLSVDGLDASGLMLEDVSKHPKAASFVSVIRDEAKKTKPDALLMADSREPFVADAVDMLVLTPSAGQQAIEAEVKEAAAACPDKLIAWGLHSVSGREQWDEALKIQHRASREGLDEMYRHDPGVITFRPDVSPIFYFATRVGTGEKDALDWKDYDIVRDIKGNYRCKFQYSHPISIRRIKAKTASWSPLAPGQVIAQPFIQPIVSSGGYDARGVKRAVVWLNNADMTGTFEIIDVTRNLQDPTRQTVCYSGRLQKAGTHIWGGNNLVADFTDFCTPGFYLLRLHLDQTIEVVDTTPFLIEENLFLKRAALAGHWYYYQRCGMELPGWHKACHTDDGILPDGTSVDLTGGWHDGGDYNKWSHYGFYGVVALLELAELEKEMGWRDPSPLPSAIDEADWEGQFLAKTLTPEGYTTSLYASGPNPWVCIGRPEEEYVRMARVDSGISPQVTAWTGACLARLAVLVRDPAAREKYVKVARKLYDIASERGMNLMDFYWPCRFEYLEVQAALLHADVSFVRLGIDRERHQRESLARLERILSQQDPAGYFYADRERTRKLFHPANFMLPLYDLSQSSISADAKQKIVSAFVRWAGFIEPSLNLTPFGQMGTIDFEKGRTELGPGGNIGVGGPGWALATTALLTGERRYLEAAQRQVSWVLGCNPTQFCMMAGVGNNPRCYHTRLAAIPEHSNGVLPGGITNGIVFAREGVPFQLGDQNTQNYVIGDNLPTDYPVVDDDVFGWTWGFIPNEYHTPQTGYFILMAVQIERAMRKLK